ncbi:MAG: tRNA (adenosine(37)-N6)-threonylcarbamoyltransferase complex dimerization subunit type 1 TsaB [Alphaproteobacteria bacterium]|nr:tRNA (adenosine(37)-N6)-threonylcarbamoyltransferase complex dimerization subunit type 1 TsaB [Alphaproteobacteria bacterium]
MYTLVFDTTAGGIAIGLYDDMKRLAKVEKIMEFGQAEALACDVETMLKEHRLCFQQIGLLGVCTGPGSFTGVRAGLAFARGLALGAPQLQITGISAFEVYAKMLKAANRAVFNAVVIETKRDDFYFQLFDERLKKLTEPMALRREDILQKLKKGQVSLIGDGVERLLATSSGLQIKSVELSEMIDIDAAFEVTYQKFLAKSLDFPKPLYIRGADACVK